MRKIIVILILTLFFIEACVQQSNKQTPQTTETKKIEQEQQEELQENCTVGWKCIEDHKKGYQFSNCVVAQVNICPNGCKDGECLPSTQIEDQQKTFTLTKGIDRMGKLGWKSSDFSERQIFEDGVTKQDFKIQLYEKTSGYNYFRIETSEPNVWILDKGIADATREDCIEKKTDARTYNHLMTKQTACIQTKENNIALIGGYWEGLPAEDTKLNWKYYS